ncbi:ubiquitinyl hydrolase 1 [Elysia marginata]|uniref:Ubiquitinyl hydrolase 1 n=1 Tax=Elysia marginata TaxID=1093978 RepID=A0AAV4FR58_9GAST|nr:ubiquitinyl hydrolase 1 [Elysia marginata]
MESCPHIDCFIGPVDESLLDPSRWQCSQCGTTEWVWACLTCANIGCGRMNEQHAEHHFINTQVYPQGVQGISRITFCIRYLFLAGCSSIELAAGDTVYLSLSHFVSSLARCEACFVPHLMLGPETCCSITSYKSSGVVPNSLFAFVMNGG